MKTGAKMSVQAEAAMGKAFGKKNDVGIQLVLFFELVLGNSVVLLEIFVMWSC